MVFLAEDATIAEKAELFVKLFLRYADPKAVIVARERGRVFRMAVAVKREMRKDGISFCGEHET